MVVALKPRRTNAPKGMTSAATTSVNSSQSSETVYVASPTLRDFHADDSRVRAVMGPIGSGKSVGMCLEILARAQMQRPFMGVRRSRWAVVRSNYRELKTTTIATFRDWLGHLGSFTYDSPIRFNADFPLDDGTRVALEVLFFPIDKAEDIESLKSLELTGAWFNEATSIDHQAVQVMRGRIGRYPAERDGGPSWHGIIMDTNPPPVDHWFYKLFEEQRPPGHRLFRQPPPLFKNANGTYSPNPMAENIENHTAGYGYYFDQIPGATEEYVKVFVLGEYGSVFTGKPVFKSFSERKHVARDRILPHRSQPIILGCDFGLNMAVVFGQTTPTGQLIVFDELTASDAGTDAFLDDELVPRLQHSYPGFSTLLIGDPTADNRSAVARQTAFDMVRERGIAAEPAPSNDAMLRLDAVNYFLGRSDGLLIDRRCSALINAMSGGYQFARAAGGGFKPLPKKDGPSHIADALQYLCLHFYRGVIRAPNRRDVAVRVQRGPRVPQKTYHYV